jgi:hypothetical protein
MKKDLHNCFIPGPGIRRIMNPEAPPDTVQEIMLDFARVTGLDPPGMHPRRYLWTDAFAVCNYLGLYCRTGDDAWRGLALRLVDQVHLTLGRYREGDQRTGWISGLSEQDGALHPTKGGLRIGKDLPERGIHEAFDERREWDRDGQYFHYLAKWMHALCRVSRVTGDPEYIRFAAELAQAASARFTYLPAPGGKRRMYWKMSTDLTSPLVPSMGQHDPLDGFVTFTEVQLAAGRCSENPLIPSLAAEIAGMADICRGMDLRTDDPLGIGGLLADASRIVQLAVQGGRDYGKVLESLMESALYGLASCSRRGFLDLPAGQRLAFRELGLATGLAGVTELQRYILLNPEVFTDHDSLQRKARAILRYVPVGNAIKEFWMSATNRQSVTWTGHRDINRVMLATSIAPEGFLMI